MFGDLLAQQAVERKGRLGHDWHRTLRLAIWGLCITGPFNCIWYQFLERYINSYDIITTSFARMALDQFIIAPIFLALFFAYNVFLEENSNAGLQPAKSLFSRGWKQQLRTKMRQNYWDVLKSNWKVWPLVQCLNFSIVPLQYRLIFVNIVALGWNAYLSVATNKIAISHHHAIKQIV